MYAWARGHAHTQTHTEFQFLFTCHLPSPSFVVLILSINSISAPFSSWWSFFVSKYIYELFAMLIVIVKRTLYVLVYLFSLSLLILTSLSFTFSLSLSKVLQEINISVETTGLALTTCLSCPGSLTYTNNIPGRECRDCHELQWAAWTVTPGSVA